MIKSNRFAFLALTVLLTCVFAVATAKTVSAADQSNQANQVKIVVRPLLILDYSAVPGHTFSIDINITALGTLDLHGFNMNLSYNPKVINCTTFELGALFTVDTVPSFSIDNTLGNVYVSANLTSQSAVINKNGTLFSLTFQVKSTGETNFHIYDVALFDPHGGTIQFKSYDGYFSNKFTFDLTMPLTLLAVTLSSMFLNPKIENKIKGTFEESEFQVRDAILLVGLMAVMITLIVVVRELSVILTVLFLFAYSLLLYTFSYLLSHKRWYIGAIPPAVFILLYVFLRNSYIWTYYLSNVYGLIFAVLITLYLAGLFNWKTTAVFGVLITAMDIILVLVTKTMVQAASAAASLSLPVLVSLPLIPTISTGIGLLTLSLGLGDFFFAGLLAVQTYKKFGKRLAVAAVLAMTVSFSIFEALILTFNIGAFPGTLMIICGWAPFAIAGTVRNWRKTKVSNLEQVVSN